MVLEKFNWQLRKVTKSNRDFISDDALMKQTDLAAMRIGDKMTMPIS